MTSRSAAALIVDHLVCMRQKAGEPVFIRRTKVCDWTLADLLEKFVEAGYVLHASSRRALTLRPAQGESKVNLCGNLKGVYATADVPRCLNHGFWSTLKGDASIFRPPTLSSLAKAMKAQKSSDEKVYVYIFHQRFFIRAPSSEYICFKEIAPDFVVETDRKECSAFADVNNALDPKNGFDWQLEKFIWAAKKVYMKNTKLLSEEHGLLHAMNVVSYGCLLARQECPKSIKDVIVGCFLHDIGRTDNSGGHEHAVEGSLLAKTIIEKNWKGLKAKEILDAIKYHADGRTSDRKITGCIWDADRLSLVRLGQNIELSLLSTPTAKRYAKMLNAFLAEASQGGYWSRDLR